MPHFVARKSPPERKTAMQISPENEFQKHADAALVWLRRSLEMTGGAGFSHSFSPFFGWENGYPETTGYLIETLFDWADLKNDPELAQIAFDQADWLVKIQLENGAWQAGIFGKKPPQPSVFNTGQILFGIAAAHNRAISGSQNSATKYLASLKKAANWMLEIQSADGSWKQANYVANFSPTYLTRAVWGILKANQLLDNQRVEPAMRRALDFYAARLTAENSLLDTGFFPGKSAPTHTIAYSIRGFLESGILLNDEKYTRLAAAVFEKLIEKRAEFGRTAGEYDTAWRGDFSFRCLTGNCQLSLIASRFFELTGDEKYHRAALDFLLEVIDYQRLDGGPNVFGAMPGSAPFWGKYLRFRYPNWAVKFLLDAIFHLQKPAADDSPATRNGSPG